MSTCRSSADTSAVERVSNFAAMSVRTSVRIGLAAAAGESSFQMRPLFFESQPVIQSAR